MRGGLYLIGCLSLFALLGCCKGVTVNTEILKPENYAVCKTDANCVISTGHACTGPIAVNKRKQKAFEKHLGRQYMTIKCMQFPSVDYGALTVHCKESVCVIEGLNAQLVGAPHERP